MVGEVKLSNGQKLAMADWRANRLVDLLAKKAAAARELPPNAVKLLDSGTVAVIAAAKLLGRVTHAANNLRVSVLGEDGNVSTQIMRDATPAPKGHKRKQGSEEAKPSPAPAKARAKVAPPVKPWSEQVEKRPRVQTADSLHDARVSAYQEACLKHRVNEIGSSLASSSRTDTAASRIEAIRRRIGERNS